MLESKNNFVKVNLGATLVEVKVKVEPPMCLFVLVVVLRGGQHFEYDDVRKANKKDNASANHLQYFTAGNFSVAWVVMYDYESL